MCLVAWQDRINGDGMRKVELMVFDFDGTLVDSSTDLTSSVNYALGVLNLPILEKETVVRFVGDGVKKLIERSLGSENHNRLDRAFDIFRLHYAEHLLDTTRLYRGVTEVLENYNNVKKLIVTNKLYSYTLAIAEGLNIVKYFDDIIGMDSYSYRKPDARLISPLLRRFGAGRDKTVVVGDGENDIKLARNGGVISCAVLNGFGNRENLLHLDPDYRCENIRELKNLFC
jgi:phosphoglycolate phosphatase